jgi:hypothetical protein
MKSKTSAASSAIIRTWMDEDKKKIVVQIEDRSEDTLASIRLSPDQASDLSDRIAISVAQMRKASKPAKKEARLPALLC